MRIQLDCAKCGSKELAYPLDPDPMPDVPVRCLKCGWSIPIGRVLQAAIAMATQSFVLLKATTKN